jgi:hypothetical protein
MIDMVFASYFCSTPDPLLNNGFDECRQHVIVDDKKPGFWKNDYTLILPLIDSVLKNGSNIIIFHDCFDDIPNIDGCLWVRVDNNTEYTPTIYRWFVYYEYLKKNKFSNLFMVDSTDVLMLKNDHIKNNTLYCGYEFRDKLLCPYVQKKIKHINILDINEILNQNKDHVLLNAGIVGGDYNICLKLLEKLTQYHYQTSKNIKISLDMPIFNYVLFKYFKDNINYGIHINTRFPLYEYNNTSIWKHK